MKQSDVAVALGLRDFMTVSRWERGVHLPSLENQIALGQALDRDVSWFYVNRMQVAA
jgi:transcriptional regulator with XRE-family HTH domain